jgi:hypothetical protein
VGGDEIYPLLGNLKPFADLIGAPYWPITPFFPLLPFPLSATPLPVKILICIGKPFELNIPKEKSEDHAIIDAEAGKLRQNIQSTLDDLLLLRVNRYMKWNLETVRRYYDEHIVNVNMNA